MAWIGSGGGSNRRARASTFVSRAAPSPDSSGTGPAPRLAHMHRAPDRSGSRTSAAVIVTRSGLAAGRERPFVARREAAEAYAAVRGEIRGRGRRAGALQIRRTRANDAAGLVRSATRRATNRADARCARRRRCPPPPGRRRDRAGSVPLCTAGCWPMNSVTTGATCIRPNITGAVTRSRPCGAARRADSAASASSMSASTRWHAGVVLAALVGERHAARRAVEETHVERRFERRQHAHDGRQRRAQRFRRRREAARDRRSGRRSPSPAACPSAQITAFFGLINCLKCHLFPARQESSLTRRITGGPRHEPRFADIAFTPMCSSAGALRLARPIRANAGNGGPDDTLGPRGAFWREPTAFICRRSAKPAGPTSSIAAARRASSRCCRRRDRLRRLSRQRPVRQRRQRRCDDRVAIIVDGLRESAAAEAPRPPHFVAVADADPDLVPHRGAAGLPCPRRTRGR